MVRRRLALAALVAVGAVACVNISQPHSRKALLDHVVELPRPAVADAPAAPAAPVRRTSPADTPEVEVVPEPGSRLGRARAMVLVRASVDKVRAILFDFPHYPSFFPNYEVARVVETKPDGVRIVHMEIGALGGLIHRWMNVAMSAPVVVGARESFGAKLIEGDVRAFDARWVLEKVPDGTRLTLESYLDARFELPAAFIDAGSASGLKDAILAIKARAEE